MTSVVERNGISGLVLRGVVIAFAAVMFGCVPKAPPAEAQPSTSVTIMVASR